ncbi:hypothetical protein [Cucumibacter marinus]|uniref:hypothetical protein n=1 Tax=Cucumibacter marinus TaxID=1121252 RepID=UPI0003F7A270|nr:hypothetical protein [Cucumibacter marinus]
MTLKRVTLIGVLGALVLAFLAIFALAVLREAPGSNSYALMADAWLQGRFDVEACFDADCAAFDGKTFIIFPPMPGVIALPFVALFGVDFQFFVPVSLLGFGLIALMWWRIGLKLTDHRSLTSVIMLLTLFATPLAFVTIRGDHVWFFAQLWGFVFVSAALFSALNLRSAVLTGLFIGMAFLCRQMSILYLPFLYVLLLDDETPLFRIDWATIGRGLRLAAFPLAAIAVYLTYNYLRFGAPMETGYQYMDPTLFGETNEINSFINGRVQDIGLFSPAYFLFNAVYMFISGPHIQFGGPYLTEMTGFDSNGASVFLVAPVLLLAFLAPWDRRFLFGFGTAALILGLTLFYHSNGFSQYSAQRYALDWLPILLIFVARGLKPEHTGAVAVLTGYAMAVTLSMLAVGGLLAGA